MLTQNNSTRAIQLTLCNYYINRRNFLYIIMILCYLKIPLHFAYRLLIFNYILQYWMSIFDIAFRDLIWWKSSNEL